MKERQLLCFIMRCALQNTIRLSTQCVKLIYKLKKKNSLHQNSAPKNVKLQMGGGGGQADVACLIHPHPWGFTCQGTTGI